MRIDHLVVGCAELETGCQWLEDRLAAPAEGGGEHLRYGTHNRLWRLDGDRYLELIARRPGSNAAEPAPFGLLTDVVQLRLAEQPRLLTWVARVDPGDDEAALRRACTGLADPVPVQRDDFRWRLAIASDFGLCAAGAIPYLIWWEATHPTACLPDVGLSLETLELRALRKDTLRPVLGLVPPSEPVAFSAGEGGLSARLRTPRGLVSLS